jgi:hypothetical protein
MRTKKEEYCAICGCRIHHNGDYAKPSIKGRSHATKHHFVAERFFGRSKNRRKEDKREGIFRECPWGFERKTDIFCYECHEELFHNPVFLPNDIRLFSKIIKARSLNEPEKSADRTKIAERIKLLHEAIEKGLRILEDEIIDK